MRNVKNLAVLLEVSEFEVFELAYTRWYGHRPDRRQLEQTFIAYMSHRCELPIYVRDYVRRDHFLLA